MHRALHVLAICLLLAGCANNENKELLECLSDIQAMGDSCPQKAMLRLDSIRPQFENETEYMRNKLALLDIRLRDKAYITHTSDSTIKQVCGYFEKHGSDREKQEAYYYMGSVYRDMNDYPRAVTSYMKAIEIAENSEDADPAIMEVSYLQLAGLYRKQFNHKEALSVSLKGLKVAEMHGFANERTYIDIANAYNYVKDTPNCMLYCNKAMNIIKHNGINIENADIVARAMSLSAKFGYKDDARHYYGMLNLLKESERPHNYMSALSVYYEMCLSVDSAAVIEHKIFDNRSDINQIYDSAKWLTIYYSNKEDYENATKYAIYCIRANETRIKERDLEGTDNAKNMFIYHRDKEGEIAIIEDAANARLWLVICVFVSIITIILSFTVYTYRKKRLLRKFINMSDEAKEIKSQIELKESELKQLVQNNADLSQKLNEAEIESKMLLEHNCALTKQIIMSELSMDAEDVINKFKEASKGKHQLVDRDWQELFCAIDKLFPDFRYEIQAKLRKVSVPMLRVCYLWKINCSNPEIVNITGYPPQTVWDRVKRIEKVFNGNVIG